MRFGWSDVPFRQKIHTSATATMTVRISSKDGSGIESRHEV
jgi:hypothetical protein